MLCSNLVAGACVASVAGLRLSAPQRGMPLGRPGLSRPEGGTSAVGEHPAGKPRLAAGGAAWAWRPGDLRAVQVCPRDPESAWCAQCAQGGVLRGCAQHNSDGGQSLSDPEEGVEGG